jgi:hypothetical protein
VATADATRDPKTPSDKAVAVALFDRFLHIRAIAHAADMLNSGRIGSRKRICKQNRRVLVQLLEWDWTITKFLSQGFKAWIKDRASMILARRSECFDPFLHIHAIAHIADSLICGNFNMKVEA